jgi:hypothetical protein
VEELPVQDDSRADAVADVDDDEVRVGAVAVAERVLADRRRLAVVQHRRGQPVALGQQLAERQVAPVQVDRVHDHAVARVDEARGSDADADERPRGRRHQAVEQLVDRGEGGVAVARGTGRSSVWRISPRRFTIAPQKRSCARSRPIRWRESATTLSRIGDLPPARSPRRPPARGPRPSARDDLRDGGAREPRDARDLARLTVALPKMVFNTRSRLCRLVCCSRRLLHRSAFEATALLFKRFVCLTD